MSIAVGSKVRLSGSTTVMIVSRLTADGAQAKCLWQNVSPTGMTPMSTIYPLALLELAEPEAKAAAEPAPAPKVEPEPAFAPAPPPPVSAPSMPGVSGEGTRRSSWLGSRL